MTNIEFIDMLKTAVDCKTLYVYGCFGAPMNEKNKKRYSTNRTYNKQKDRQAKILSSTDDTFGFDCVCLIKGVLWGWCADKTEVYGGALYDSNGVPDTTIDTLFNKYCTNQSKDFSKIEIGEMLYMDGHCGVYIGDGYAIESAPIWEDGVQITEVWNIKKTNSKGRKWISHGKLNAVDYIEKPIVKKELSVILNQNITDDEISAIDNSLNSIGFNVKFLSERGR